MSFENDDDQFRENIDRFAPETGPTAAEEKRARKHGLAPSNVGDFETMAVASMTDLAQPLHLSPAMLKDGAGPVIRYQEGYNMYVTPLRATLRALGRADDMLKTGAPSTPAQLLARPSVAKRFAKLSLDTKADGAAQSAVGNWADAQTRMKLDADQLMAQQVNLKSATENYRAVQLLLQQRQKEALRDGLSAQVAGIEHAADVCARVVEVSAEAVSGAAEIGEAVEGSGEVIEPTDMEETGTVEEAGFDQWSTGQQKAGSAVENAGKGISRGAAIAKQVHAYATGNKPFELRDVFIVAGGGTARYNKLNAEIKLLNVAIGKLDATREQEMIHAAGEQLLGFKLTLGVEKQTLNADRRNARNRAQEAAQNWAGSKGKGDESSKDAVFAMYSAEAYQELDVFATHARSERESYVDPEIDAVDSYLTSKVETFESKNLLQDASDLRHNVVVTRHMKKYFDDKVPEWEGTAQAWRDFLQDRTTKSLIYQDGAAERASATED